MGRKLFPVLVLVAIAALVIFNLSIKEANTSTALNQESLTPKPEAIVPPVEAAQITSVDSPDATKTLVMKITNKGSETGYSFFVSGKNIFTKIVGNSTTFSIPYNTWSPNSKYVFLKETHSLGSEFFILSVSADSSLQDDQTANITGLFAKKYRDLAVEDVTGWGGIDLVIVNSVKKDGTRGPSFWFEMPSHAIIQLSTRF